MTAAPIRVGLAAGSAITRAGLRAVLESAGLAVAAEADALDGLTRAGAGDGAEVWVVDASFGGGVLTAVEALAERRAGVPVVVMSDHDDARAALAALSAGASGYLPSDTPAGRLPHILRCVLAGEAAVPRALMRRVLDQLQAERRRLVLSAADGRSVTLSPRESAVLRQLALGRSSNAIATELGVSAVTVRRHVSSAVRKLGARSRADAVALIARRASG